MKINLKSLKNNFKSFRSILGAFRRDAYGYSMLISFGKFGFFFNRQDKSFRFGLGLMIVTLFNYDYEVYINNCLSAVYYRTQVNNMPKKIITSRDLKK